MIHNYKLYVFGSRAKNRAKKYSDINLAIDFQELTPQIKTKLEFTFENSTLPYEVDIINLNDIDNKFKNLIQKDLIEILFYNLRSKFVVRNPQRKILRTLQKIRSNFFNKILYPILTSGKILPLYFEIKII